MLLNSLIILLLSNSITLRRDKSILYSRATITILLVSSLIAYDNLYFFLFLNHGTEFSVSFLFLVFYLSYLDLEILLVYPYTVSSYYKDI